MDSRQEALQRRLGYRFTQHGLLSRALTHRSFGAEHNEPVRLGQQRRKAAAKTAQTDETIAETLKKAGRSKKAAEPAAKPTKGRKKASAAVAAE